MSGDVWLLDSESDSFAALATRVHCLSYARTSGEPELAVGHADVLSALERMDSPGAVVVAHHGFGHDYHLVDRVLGFKFKHAKLEDSLILSRLFWPDIESVGYKERHSIASWGVRVKLSKGAYEDWCAENGLDPWKEYRPEMGAYCQRDVKILRQLWFKCEEERRKHNWELSIRLKYGLAKELRLQESTGVYIDHALAKSFVNDDGGVWKERVRAIDAELSASVPWTCTRYEDAPNFRKDGQPTHHAVQWLKTFAPAPRIVAVERGRGKTLRVEQEERYDVGPFVRCEWSQPTWSSRQQMIELLKGYGWVPTEFTEKGNPRLTEESLTHIEGNVGKLLAERFRLEKRIALIEGILENLRPDGRVAARCTPQAAQTGRCTHAVVTSIPRPTSPFGKECRSIFAAPPGRVLMSADADALEARCLAHYMNDPAFTERVVNGDKDRGTDMHSYNSVLWQLEPKKQYTFFGVEDSGRGHSKRGLYGLIYGCADPKLGRILGGDDVHGKMQRGRLMAGLPLFAQLTERVEDRVCEPVSARDLERARKTGRKPFRNLKEGAFLLGLDGRKIPVRAVHAAINTLLQGAGATIMEVAILYVLHHIRKRKLDAKQVIFMHDEQVLDCANRDVAEECGKLFLEGLTYAETFLKVRCKLAGTYQIGANWGQVH